MGQSDYPCPKRILPMPLPDLDPALRASALALIQEAGGRGLEVSAYAEAMVALVEEQPEYAIAKAQLQEVHWLLEKGNDPSNALRTLRAEAQETLKLNPSLSEARIILALAGMAQAEATRSAIPLRELDKEIAAAFALKRIPVESLMAEAAFAEAVRINGTYRSILNRPKAHSG